MKVRLRSARRYLRCLFHPRVLVLLYHHVRPPGLTPPEITIAPERFEEQMALLGRRGLAIGVDQLLDSYRGGRLPRGGRVLVTLDDAPEDTLRYAIPILRRHRVPATVFVPTGLVARGGECWWSRLFVLTEYAASRGIDLPSWLQQSHTRLTSPDPRTRFWKRVRMLSAEEIDQLLDQAAGYLGHPALPATPSPMTRAELAAIENDGVITLGAHTVTHPMLEAIPDEQLTWELNTSRSDLAGHPAYRDVFAYPYGDSAVVTHRTHGAVRAAGFQAAFTTSLGCISAELDRWTLPRVGIDGMSPEAFYWTIDHYLSGKPTITA